MDFFLILQDFCRFLLENKKSIKDIKDPLQSKNPVKTP